MSLGSHNHQMAQTQHMSVYAAAAWLVHMTGRGVLVELLLKPLVGIVDAQLLKAVFLEALKAVDVQDAEGQLALPLPFR